MVFIVLGVRQNSEVALHLTQPGNVAGVREIEQRSVVHKRSSTREHTVLIRKRQIIMDVYSEIVRLRLLVDLVYDCNVPFVSDT